MDSAESSSPVRSNGDGEMNIFVQSEYHGNFVLEVENSNTIEDVFITVLPIWRLKAIPEPKLYFNGQRLEREKSLADYGIDDGSILHLECTDWTFRVANIESELEVYDEEKSEEVKVMVEEPEEKWGDGGGVGLAKWEK
uniref:Ubiquitin-like domain-containing protein n=1 Tax=Ananas comosus var. bracteatus TaxID=296719 RepID=A0A6V7QDI3_ANACO|nr:unnamed protein product [Ananas comosus var. bracteatus]